MVKRVGPEFAAYGYDGGWSDEEATFTGEPGEDPPEGEGYQVWQDVSEATPISPVFLNRDDCAAWVTRTHECSLVAALAFIESGWAPSFIGTQFGVYSGVQMSAELGDHLDFIAPAGSHRRGTRIRHTATGTDGRIEFRMPPPNGEYYAVTWDRGLPTLVADDPSIDPDKPMEAGCREDGFEVLS